MFLHGQLEFFDVDIEVTTPDGTSVSSISAPKMMVEREFLSLVLKASRVSDPVKIKIKRMIPVHSQLDNCMYDRECSIEFMNHAYTRSYGEAT